MQTSRALIIGSYGTGNLGDESILAGLVEILVNQKNYRKKDLLVFSRDPEETFSLHGVMAKRKNLVDIVLAERIIIGGGELIQDLGCNALKYTTLGLVAKVIGKRVSFCAIGVSSTRSRIGKLLIRLSLNLADEVSVRDRRSKDRLNMLGVRRRIVVIDDPSVCVEPISRGKAVNLLRNEGIGVEGRDILIGLTSQHTFNVKSDEGLHNFVLEFSRHMLTKYPSVNIVFVPFNASKDCPADRDTIYGKWLERKLNTDRFKILESEYKPEEIKAIMGLFHLVVSTRLHPLIFASEARVPQVGIVISEKIEGWSDYAGCPVAKVNELKELCRIAERVIERALGAN